MKKKISTIIFTLLLCGQSISCGGAQPIQKVAEKAVPQKITPHPTLQFRYRFHLNASGSMTTPHDDINIDTNGQMVFDTQQHMKDGTWKSPHGMAFLEPRDEDTLLSFIKRDILFSIDESDVSPSCPNGDHYSLQISRTDLQKKLSITTNTCAAEYNLLTGDARKIFPAFLAYLNRLRDRYRPLFTD
jgi:hypothetical protein